MIAARRVPLAVALAGAALVGLFSPTTRAQDGGRYEPKPIVRDCPSGARCAWQTLPQVNGDCAVLRGQRANGKFIGPALQSRPACRF